MFYCSIIETGTDISRSVVGLAVCTADSCYRDISSKSSSGLCLVFQIDSWVQIKTVHASALLISIYVIVTKLLSRI
jgi:hypothetical protein